MLIRLFGLMGGDRKKQQLVGEHYILHSAEIHNSNSSQKIIRVIK